MSKFEKPSVYGATDLTYDRYLKVDELLNLQKLQSNPAHPDELLFITIHQVYELWFKLMLHEIDQGIAHLNGDEILRARHHVARVVEIMKLLVQQIHILETMTPADFLHFRGYLKSGSGFQSVQFRELEFAAGLKDESYFIHFKNRPDMLGALEKRRDGQDLRDAFYELLRRKGHKIPKGASALEHKDDASARVLVIEALRPVYENPSGDLPLYLLCESLVDFDEGLSLWRQHHVKVVERIIGKRRGTGGSSGVAYLESTTTKRLFPWLWEMRAYLDGSDPNGGA